MLPGSIRRPWSSGQGYVPLRGRGLPTRCSLGTLALVMLAATVASALGIIWLAHSPNSPIKDTRHIQLPHQHSHGALLPGAAGASAGSSVAGAVSGGQQQQAPVPRLDYPLWWHAPFVAQSGAALSGSGSGSDGNRSQHAMLLHYRLRCAFNPHAGLGTEAIMIIEALISTRQMRAEGGRAAHACMCHSRIRHEPATACVTACSRRRTAMHRPKPQRTALYFNAPPPNARYLHHPLWRHV